MSATAATTAKTTVEREGLPKKVGAKWGWQRVEKAESRSREKNQNNHKFGMSNDNFSSPFPPLFLSLSLLRRGSLICSIFIALIRLICFLFFRSHKKSFHSRATSWTAGQFER